MALQIFKHYMHTLKISDHCSVLRPCCKYKTALLTVGSHIFFLSFLYLTLITAKQSLLLKSVKSNIYTWSVNLLL
jgi:hypothetical protein